MIHLIVTTINSDFNKDIYKSITKEKKTWKKNLNKVKAFTSGNLPRKQYFKTLSDDIIKTLKEQNGNNYEMVKWWANYYEKGHHTIKHNHTGEDISSILIVKGSKYNPLTFYDKSGEKIKIVEKDGLLLIFEGHVEHSVDVCKDSRVTLAMDFRLYFDKNL